MAFLDGKPSTSHYMDALIIAGIKTAEERLLAPFIGNGTLVSGIAKGVIAVVIPTLAKNNKYANLASTAFIIDSAEDLVNTALQYIGWGSNGAGTSSGMVI